MRSVALSGRLRDDRPGGRDHLYTLASKRKGGDTRLEIKMKKARTTKNFVLYEGDGAVENLYVKQEALTQPYPEEITITLT